MLDYISTINPDIAISILLSRRVIIHSTPDQYYIKMAPTSILITDAKHEIAKGDRKVHGKSRLFLNMMPVEE